MRPIVLIADADELLAAAYRAFLVAEGFDVHWVTNGLDCLEEIREHSPQALILDAELPWGSGVGVLEVLANDPTVPQIPAVLLTASPQGLPHQCCGGALAAMLLKPVVPAKVARTLRELLEAGELARLH